MTESNLARRLRLRTRKRPELYPLIHRGVEESQRLVVGHHGPRGWYLRPRPVLGEVGIVHLVGFGDAGAPIAGFPLVSLLLLLLLRRRRRRRRRRRSLVRGRLARRDVLRANVHEVSGHDRDTADWLVGPVPITRRRYSPLRDEHHNLGGVKVERRGRQGRAGSGVHQRAKRCIARDDARERRRAVRARRAAVVAAGVHRHRDAAARSAQRGRRVAHGRVAFGRDRRLERFLGRRDAGRHREDVLARFERGRGYVATPDQRREGLHRVRASVGHFTRETIIDRFVVSRGMLLGSAVVSEPREPLVRDGDAPRVFLDRHRSSLALRGGVVASVARVSILQRGS